MNRFFAAAAVAALAAGLVVADVPPPAGFKRVQVDHKITTDKDLPDYEFFTLIGKDRVSAVKLDSKTSVEILAKDRGGRFFGCTFVAVPKESGKNYASEKEYFAAIAASKVEGLVKAKQTFGTQMQVKDSDPRDKTVTEYKLDKVDKDGIVLVVKKDEPNKDAPKKDGGKDAPDDGDAPVATVPHGGTLVAGLAACAAVLLGGFWVVGRIRHKV
jgi:hypothetical protein